MLYFIVLLPCCFGSSHAGALLLLSWHHLYVWSALCERFRFSMCRLFSWNQWVFCLAFLHVNLIWVFFVYLNWMSVDRKHFQVYFMDLPLIYFECIMMPFWLFFTIYAWLSTKFLWEVGLCKWYHYHSKILLWVLITATSLFSFVFIISIYGMCPCCFSCAMLFNDVLVIKW
jgi:hypothetical protein